MPTAEVVIEEGEFLSPTPSMSGDARASSLRFGGNGGDRRYITFSTGNDSADNSAHGGGDLSPSPTLPGTSKDKSHSSHLGSHRDAFHPFMPVGVPQFDVGIRFGGLHFGMGSGGSRSESSTPRPLGDLEDGEASSDPTSSMHAAAAAAAAAAMAGLGFSPGMSLIESHVGLGFSLGSREKPYKCEQCGQCYKYLSAFTKHKEQNHTARLPGEKPFRCEVCGMQFKYLKSFKKHRLNHAVERLHPAYHCAMGMAEEHRSVLEMLARPGGHLPLLMVPEDEDHRPARAQAGPSHHGCHRGDPDVKMEGRLSGASSVSSENNEGRSGGEGGAAVDALPPPRAGADSPSAAHPNADHLSVSSSRCFSGPSTSAMAVRQICVCPLCRMKFVNEESLRIHSLSCMDRLARQQQQQQQQQSSVTLSLGNAQLSHSNHADPGAAAASSTSSSSSASSSSAGVLSSNATCTTSPFATSLQETVRQHQAMIAAGLFARNAMPPPPGGMKPFPNDAKTNNATSGGASGGTGGKANTNDGATAEEVPSDDNMEGSDREGSDNDLTEDAPATSSNNNTSGAAPSSTTTPPASSSTSSLVVSSNHQSPNVSSVAAAAAAATLQQQRHPVAHLSGAAAMSSPFMSGMFREFTAAAAAAAATAMAAGVPPPEYDPGRPHLCPFCGKGFRAKENLKLHIRKHTGERPFECEFCGRAFGGKSDMNRHLRIHTGERPYRCDACGKTFARADYLSKHLSTHLV